MKTEKIVVGGAIVALMINSPCCERMERAQRNRYIRPFDGLSLGMCVYNDSVVEQISYCPFCGKHLEERKAVN